nr:GNAT family N-acetyltransferase [uncultured Sphingosinicella sp.]
MVPIVETERLRLRTFREQDLERWSAVMADPVTVRHLGGQPHAREDTWRRLLMSGGLWLIYGYGYWAVERKEDGLLVGQVGLADFKREMTPSIEGIPEAGWIFAPDAHGRGYASEAVSALLAWADEAVDAPEIVAIIDPANAPSIRVAERCGFNSREDAVYKGDPILLFRRPAR